MAYISLNLAEMTTRVGAVPYSEWVYDTTDTHTTVGAAGYISDAAFSDGAVAKHGGKGLRKGDRIKVRTWSALPTDSLLNQFTAPTTAPTLSAISEFMVMGVSVTTGAADLALISYTDLVNID